MLIGNFDLAGTERFVTHTLTADEHKTFCGLTFGKLHGDWQALDKDGNPTCNKCARINNKRKKKQIIDGL